jgi:alpha-tubulin suppressor-like RCC1 family protein
MRYVAALMMSLSLSLASCSYLLPSTTPSAFGLLADKGDTRPFEKPLPINTQPKRLALGYDFAIGVKEDGTVWSWGSQSCGRLGTGAMWEGTTNTPTQITGIADFVEVAAGSNHILALRKDGTVWSWGENKQGQLGYKEDGYAEAATSQYKAVYYSCQLTPKQIPDLKDVVSIAAGSEVSYALDRQGNVYRWGLKELSRDRKHDVLTPTPQQIYHHADAVRVVSNGPLMVLMRDGKVKLLASPPEAWLSIAIKTTETVEAVLPNQTVYELKLPMPVIDTGYSRWCGYFLLNDGSVWAIGDNRNGGLGQGDLSQYQGLVKVKSIGRITKIACSSDR